MAEETQKSLQPKRVAVNFITGDDVQTRFVTNLVVQHQPEHFIISFFEAKYPAILGATVEERQAVVDAIASVDAVCVARMVITPGKMREFLEVLNDNFGKYETAVTDKSTEKSEK